MTRRDVIVKAMAGQLIWIQAADTLAMSPRHRKRRDHATPTSTTYLPIDHPLPQLLGQRPCVLQVAGVEGFGESGVMQASHSGKMCTVSG